MKKARAQTMLMLMVSRVVAPGLRMKGVEKFMARASWRGGLVAVALVGLAREIARQAAAEPGKRKVDHRGGEEGQHLADDEPADDGDAERVAQLRAGAGAEHQRQRAE